MASSVTIEHVRNGYLVSFSTGREVYTSLDDVFTALLSTFEGRYAGFGGESYGRVAIDRRPPPPASTEVIHAPMPTDY